MKTKDYDRFFHHFIKDVVQHELYGAKLGEDTYKVICTVGLWEYYHKLQKQGWIRNLQRMDGSPQDPYALPEDRKHFDIILDVTKKTRNYVDFLNL